MDELTKKKISNTLKGKKKSANHKKHISESLTGRKLRQEHKNKIKESVKKYREKILYISYN